MTMTNVWHPSNDRQPGTAPGADPSFDAFFSYGFRPFFLGASVYAVVVMAIWLGWVLSLAAGGQGAWLPVAGSPFAWHAHEMILGFAGAAIAGFLLTAVPNWTGALPLSGPPLVILFSVWLAGRLAMATAGLLPFGLAAAIDVAFLPLLGVFAARQLMTKPAPRNLIFLAILAAITSANIAYHLAVLNLIAIDPLAAVRTGLLAVAVMIAIIGGRIIPAFTHNWLHLNAWAGPMPRKIDELDAASILSIVAVLIAKIAAAPLALIGALALLAAALNAVRLVLWRGWATLSEPIVWVLHLGYAWLVAGLLLTGLSSFAGATYDTLASHAIGTGAVGTMILAVMSRASLGHTGRPIKAPPAIVASYLILTLAAALRVIGPLIAPDAAHVAHALAGLLWTTAFALFVWVYAPILTTPRVHSKVAR